MGDLKTVKISSFAADLAIAKTYLADNGIDCVVNSEYLSVSVEKSGARLQVREEDYQRAMRLLVRGGFVRSEDFEYGQEK